MPVDCFAPSFFIGLAFTLVIIKDFFIDQNNEKKRI
jgi:hypothetical protein